MVIIEYFEKIFLNDISRISKSLIYSIIIFLSSFIEVWKYTEIYINIARLQFFVIQLLHAYQVTIFLLFINNIYWIYLYYFVNKNLMNLEMRNIREKFRILSTISSQDTRLRLIRSLLLILILRAVL